MGSNAEVLFKEIFEEVNLEKMKKRIVLLTYFSNSDIRSKLDLGYPWWSRKLRSLFHRPGIVYHDISFWISAYIKIFERYNNFEFHVVSLHAGMKHTFQEFELGGVYYHFINRDLPFPQIILEKLFHPNKRIRNKKYRREIVNTITKINPTLFILSGAENAEYAEASLDIKAPQLVILQTLLNSPKRIELNVGNPYRRLVEKEILSNANFFAVTDKEEETFIQAHNPQAVFFPFVYPTTQPPVFLNENKVYDFVFFAGVISRFKGAYDAVEAFYKVIKKHPKATMAIIGTCSMQAQENLIIDINKHGAKNNIFILGSFLSRKDMFQKVQKAKYAVLPSITAPLNTTVREAMLLGMPTIVYGNETTRLINQGKGCLLEAKMENVDDLAKVISYSLEHEEDMKMLSINAKEYADSHFSINAVEKNMHHIIDTCVEIIS